MGKPAARITDMHTCPMVTVLVPHVGGPPFVFTSERGSPFSTSGFAKLVERAGVEAKLGFKAHPHMLRHACGFALANKGHDTRALGGVAVRGHFRRLIFLSGSASDPDFSRPGRFCNSGRTYVGGGLRPHRRN